MKQDEYRPHRSPDQQCEHQSNVFPWYFSDRKNYFLVSLYQYNWQYVLSTKMQIKSVDKVIMFYQIYSSVFDHIELQTFNTGTFFFQNKNILAGKYYIAC